MKIIIDAMGGDNAPSEIVKGALEASERLGLDIILVGRREEIETCIPAASTAKYEIVDARDVITMEDDPSTATRRKKDSSMTVALQLLKNGDGDAVVSAGSTGALLTGATLIVKRIKGIRRAAMAPLLPIGPYGMILIDCGANAECSPDYLMQFALLGSLYSKKILGAEYPRVGLLNVGTEDTKGDELRHETFKLLKEASDSGRINFVGNVEASGAFSGAVEVLVTDGFTGNVFLKCIEGVSKLLFGQLKGVFYKSTVNKLAAAVIKSDLKEMKKQLDPNEIGGTAFLGISKPVIKAHGSSNASAIVSAVKQAAAFADSGFLNEIEENIDLIKVDTVSEN